MTGRRERGCGTTIPARCIVGALGPTGGGSPFRTADGRTLNFAALGVSVPAQIPNLLLDPQERLHLTFAFVAHNLGGGKHVCDRVTVMYVGRLVELAESGAIYRTPRHPCTAALMAYPRPIPSPLPG